MKLIQVAEEGDSLFGKVFEAIKEDGEHFLAIIETDAGDVVHWFHRKHVTPITEIPTAQAVTTPATTEQVTDSTVVVPVTAPATPPALQTPPGLESIPSAS